MALTKVLITVKTYPSISKKYDELVCTAGFLPNGEMIRIYPIPYRKLDYNDQYRKYQWIEVDIVKNTRDRRPESFRPRSITSQIKPLETIHTKSKSGWEIRKSIVLRNVYTDFNELINLSKDRECNKSLAVFKPSEVINFYWEKDEEEWSKDKIDSILAKRAQLNLFEESEDFSIVDKLPFKFKYEFADTTGKVRNLMIEDWEVGALYWKMLNKRGSQEEALQDVKNRFFDYMATRDLYFYVGTSLKHHFSSINPFMIIGVFYPPKENQLCLF